MFKPIYLAVPVVIAFLTVSSVPGAMQRRLVGNLKKNEIDGCGCYFKFRGTPVSSDRYIFASTIDDEKSAWMNIGGRDVKLTLVKEEWQREKERMGSRSTQKWNAGDIDVDVSYVVTRMCRPNDENCESTGYSATFVVKKGAASQTVKAAGSCGC